MVRRPVAARMATGELVDALEDGEVRTDGSGAEGCGNQAHAGEMDASATQELGADQVSTDAQPFQRCVSP